MRISDRELWAVALIVERDHGAQAMLHAGERLGAAMDTGDLAGINLWTAVAERLEQLGSCDLRHAF